MATLSFVAKSDYPPKTAVFKIPENATTLDLKQAASAALEIVEGVKYGFFAVAFGEDVVELNDDKVELSKLRVKDKATIVMYAPSSVRPARVQKKKEKKKEEKVDVKSEKDKYKGFTVKNALKKWESGIATKRRLALEFIEIYAKEIFATPGFKQLPQSVVISLLKRESLNIPEVDLFEAVLDWGKAELLRQGKEETVDNLRSVVSELLPHVRFPIMSTQDIALKVNPTGMLSQSQIVELFTYLGLRASSGKNPPKLGRSLKFVAKPRKPRMPPAWFRWDPTRKHNSLTLSTDLLTITSNNTSYYQPVLGDVVLSTGMWEWEVVLSQIHSNQYSCNIGVVPASTTTFQSSYMIGYPGHMPGWAFAAGHGQKYHNAQTGYGRVCTSGDVVRLRVDLDKKTLEFWINGQSQGVAYTDVVGPVRPAVSLYGTNTVTLRFCK